MILILSILSLLIGQSRVGEWEALTSVIDFRDIVCIDEVIFAATGGGILKIEDNVCTRERSGNKIFRKKLI